MLFKYSLFYVRVKRINVAWQTITVTWQSDGFLQWVHILSLTSANLHLSIPHRFFLHMKNRIFNCPDRSKLQSHCAINPLPQLNNIALFFSEIWWSTSGITPAKLHYEALFFLGISIQGQGLLRQQHNRRPLWNEWMIKGYLEMLLCKTADLGFAGWTRHCGSTAANSLSVTSSLPDMWTRIQFSFVWCAITHMRAKVSLQRVRGLVLLPAESSSDNPQILFQPMTDNGALSCTAATGQGGIFLRHWRGFSIIPLLEKMSEMWLKIVTLSHKLLPLLHKSHLFRARHTKEVEKKPKTTVTTAANQRLRSEDCRAASNGNICSLHKWSHLACMTSKWISRWFFSPWQRPETICGPQNNDFHLSACPFILFSSCY